MDEDIDISDIAQEERFNQSRHWMEDRLKIVRQAKYDFFNSAEVFKRIGMVNNMLNILSLEAHSESDSLSTGIENEDGSGKGTDDLSGSGSGDSEKEMHIDTFFDYQDSWNYDYYDYSSPGTPRALEIKRVKHFAELMAKKSKLQSGLV